jgi:hypothetical protein
MHAVKGGRDGEEWGISIYLFIFYGETRNQPCIELCRPRKDVYGASYALRRAFP